MPSQTHSRPHFFWTGKSAPETATNYWRERLKAMAVEAGVVSFRPHRLRDTFAVELLLAGVSMADVSTLLGHSSVQTTEKYYAPWNQARRSRLVSIVKDIHRQDPILPEVVTKKPARTAPTALAEAGLATSHVPKPTRSLCIG